MKKIYITTTIPYVNSTPHIGHALEFVQADIYARFCRRLNFDVYLQSGTDEHSIKCVKAAKSEEKSTSDLVDTYAREFLLTLNKLNISIDNFIRTSELCHKRSVKKFFKRLDKSDLYKKDYQGLYCEGCEDFYKEDELVDGYCPKHNVAPVKVKEKNYFFRLSRYQDEIEQLIACDIIEIFPKYRKNEILQFIKKGLHDFSTTRSLDRTKGWGIPYPFDEQQVVYVWTDALINYLSGIGFEDVDKWEKYWNSQTLKIHVLGKDVWKFHAIYWIGLLLSAKLPLPNKLLIHGFLTNEGEKISKTLGNADSLFSDINRYGTEGVRYFLARGVSPFADGNYSKDLLKNYYNNEIVNGLGNLISRLTTLCEKAGLDEVITGREDHIDLRELYNTFEYRQICEYLVQKTTEINQEINHQRPWQYIKADIELLHKLLRNWINRVREIIYWFSPILPETCDIADKAVKNPIKKSGAIFQHL